MKLVHEWGKVPLLEMWLQCLRPDTPHTAFTNGSRRSVVPMIVMWLQSKRQDTPQKHLKLVYEEVHYLSYQCNYTAKDIS